MPEGPQIACITGVTGGLGGAVARTFRDAGALVLGVARRAFADGIQADVTTDAGARAAVAQALARAGRIDALVHLVGGFAGGKPVAETDDAAWRLMMDLNLHSAFYIARAVLPHMCGRRSGRIVMIGSRVAVEPAATLSAYGVSKAGLVALTRTIAAEVKDYGVTANIVLPSVIDTPANRAANPAADYSKWVKPESVARLVFWLTSAEAADINGAAIPIYGRA
jgi:NAD(P)-dependent dehydrogenase (short-subunit alcohol dehydrogenase family)